MTENKKYEVRGHVKVSGEWYKIIGTSIITDEPIVETPARGESNVNPEFIEEYSPPKQKAYDWVPKHYDLSGTRVDRDARESLNAWLTDQYGDPTIRTYDGKPAEEFKLNPTDDVLVWSALSEWVPTMFEDLEEGDIWRKMPPDPKI